MALFGKKSKYTIVKVKPKDIPHGLWTKCQGCGELIYRQKLQENHQVCERCDYHFSLGAHERLTFLCDEGTFEEMDATLASLDPLSFEGPKMYKDKLAADRAKIKLRENAVDAEKKELERRAAELKSELESREDVLVKQVEELAAREVRLSSRLAGVKERETKYRDRKKALEAIPAL